MGGLYRLPPQLPLYSFVHKIIVTILSAKLRLGCTFTLFSSLHLFIFVHFYAKHLN